jgi:outer membrane protein assembly factor BamA
MCQCLHGQSLMCQRPSSDSEQKTKITIADVEFSGTNPLSEEARADLIERVKKLELRQPKDGDESDWLGQIGSEIRDTLQKQGYFKTYLTVKPYLVQSEAHELRYIVRAEIDSGPQYRLAQITFSGATVFGAKELREQFSLHEGDLFNVSEIRTGMDSLSRLYQRLGFIDMVPEPEANIDEKDKQISVVLKIDENRQYHVKTIEIYGLSPAVEQAVQSQVTPGEVFNPKSIDALVERYKSEVPSNLSTQDVIRIRRDGTTATVDILLDFRPCPPTIIAPIGKVRYWEPSYRFRDLPGARIR